MFRVRWEETTLSELAELWMRADAALRRQITIATQEVDHRLSNDATGEGESRAGGRRILFATPLGVTYRVEPDGQTASVLRVWLLVRRR